MSGGKRWRVKEMVRISTRYTHEAIEGRAVNVTMPAEGPNQRTNPMRDLERRILGQLLTSPALSPIVIRMALAPGRLQGRGRLDHRSQEDRVHRHGLRPAVPASSG